MKQLRKKFPSEMGMVILIVVILLLVLSLISAEIFLQSAFGLKTVYCLQKQIAEESGAENHLREQEREVHARVKDGDFNGAIAFVPDHLEFGCQTGIKIF